MLAGTIAMINRAFFKEKTNLPNPPTTAALGQYDIEVVATVNAPKL